MGGRPAKQVVGPPAFCPEKLRKTSTSILRGLLVSEGTKNRILAIDISVLG